MKSTVAYEWNEAKRAGNLAKHGVDFQAADDFDWATAIIDEDTRRDYGEARFFALGMIGSRLHAMVFTPRDGEIRIISLRKASRKEEHDYDQ